MKKRIIVVRNGHYYTRKASPSSPFPSTSPFFAPLNRAECIGCDDSPTRVRCGSCVGVTIFARSTSSHLAGGDKGPKRLKGTYIP